MIFQFPLLINISRIKQAEDDYFSLQSESIYLSMDRSIEIIGTTTLENILSIST